MITNHFSSYSLPDFSFDISDIYNFPKPRPIPVQYKAPVLAADVLENIQKPRTFNPVVPKVKTGKTIAFTVVDQNETLPGANIAIDGIDVAMTDKNGRVTLANIKSDSIITITYIGFADYSSVASEIPSRVVLTESAVELDEIVIQNKFKKTAKVIEAEPKSSSTWMWWLAGGIAALGIYSYSNTGVKVVKAKI